MNAGLPVAVEKVTLGGHHPRSFQNIRVSGIIGKVIYLAYGSLTNGHWAAGSVVIGRQRLLKVTNQGLLKRYIDLTVKFDQVCV